MALSEIKFTKMEGIGNDYVYINDLNEQIPDLGALAIEMSERHFGIGSDGIIVLRHSDQADFKMRMFNLDGSEGRMCGNGIRCLAKFIYDSDLFGGTDIAIETLSGIKKIQLLKDEVTGEVIGARVNMGRPMIQAGLIPIQTDQAEWINHPLQVDGVDYHVTGVSMGNPHIVIYDDQMDELDLTELGPKFEYHPLFPERMNTEFVQVISKNEVSMRVWERGSGETLACGTGACAVVVASVLNNKTSNQVKVNLLGGQLNIFWDRDGSGDIYMEGPARTSFTGHYHPRSL